MIMAGTATPREVIDAMLDEGMIESPKQAWRTLEKWLRKGIYNYGVSLDLGWLEDSNFSFRYHNGDYDANISHPVFSLHDCSHPEIESGHDMSFVLEHELKRLELE